MHSTYRLTLIFLIFAAIFIGKSIFNMYSIPLHDFDGANRAEGAKQMKAHNEYLAPLTGSPFLRNKKLKLKIQDNPPAYLYYHLERPPLVYWLMIISTSIFGTHEFFYRLPSFLFGLAIFIALIFFYKKLTKFWNSTALAVGILVLITASDWWSSSQQALLDTGLSFFLFCSMGFLLLYQKTKLRYYLYFSGLSIGLAVLSKGPPTAIIAFPILFMVFARSFKLKDFLILIGSTLLIIGPWIIAIGLKFGFVNAFEAIFVGFVLERAAQPHPTQQAPFFWYIRWWLDTLRPGFNLFILVVLYDVMQKQLSKIKLILLTYIGGGLILYAISRNNVWWYVLPLIPTLALYVSVSLPELLKKKIISLNMISVILLISSVPIFYLSRTTITLLYGLVLVVVSYGITKIKKLQGNNIYFFASAVFLSLLLFMLRFPIVQPLFPETKNVAAYLNEIPGEKCLYVQNMPYESALFYSSPDEVQILHPHSSLSPLCTNYLITPSVLSDQTLLYKYNRLHLYKL